jgi:hypothetical protein
MDALELAAGAPRPGPERVAPAAQRRADERLGPPDHPPQHTDGVGQQAGVGRVADRRPDHRAVDPQLPPARHIQLPGEPRHVIRQRVQVAGGIRFAQRSRVV